MSDPIRTTEQLGAAIRGRRKSLKLRIEDVALSAGVNSRFVSELERGKKTAEIELALRVAQAVGLDVFIESRGRQS